MPVGRFLQVVQAGEGWSAYIQRPAPLALGGACITSRERGRRWRFWARGYLQVSLFSLYWRQTPCNLSCCITACSPFKILQHLAAPERLGCQSWYLWAQQCMRRQARKRHTPVHQLAGEGFLLACSSTLVHHACSFTAATLVKQSHSFPYGANWVRSWLASNCVSKERVVK